MNNPLTTLGYWASKKVAGTAGVLAGVASMAGDKPGVLDNIVATYKVPKEVFDAGAAYVSNTGVRDFVNGRMGNLIDLFGNTAENLYERPLETLVTAAAIGLTVAHVPHAVKYGRRMLGKKDK